MIHREFLREIIERYVKTPKHHDGSIMGSMTTQPHPLAILAHILFIHTNSADPVVFREIDSMRIEVVERLNRLYGNNCMGDCGLITSGGTESNILAILAARKTRRGRSNIVLAPDTVHSSIDKACDILSCRLIRIPTGNEPVEPGILEEYIRRYDPFAVVVTAGTTERGLIDPVKEAGALAKEYGVYLHVDAAYGGLLIPFLHKHGLVDTDLKFYDGVSSISIDFHKNGMTPIPSGVILFSSGEYLDEICYPAEYTLYGRYCGLLGTRPGSSTAAIWAMLHFLGLSYYEENALRMYRLAQYTYNRLSEITDLYVFKPILPIIVFRHKSIDYMVILEKLVERRIYLYKSPSLKGLRIVVMPHIREEHIDRFSSVLVDILNEITSSH